jgi:hypothetical protein
MIHTLTVQYADTDHLVVVALRVCFAARVASSSEARRYIRRHVGRVGQDVTIHPRSASRRALKTLWALRSLGADRPLRARWSRCAVRPRWSCWSRLSLRARWSDWALRPL